MILDDLSTPFLISNGLINTAKSQSQLQEGSLSDTALNLAQTTTASINSNNLYENVAAPVNTSSTSTILPTSHQEQQQQAPTLSSGGTNKSTSLVLPIDRTSILTVESILTTPSTQSNSPSGSAVMTMAGEATTFFDDMMEDICASSTSAPTMSTSASGTVLASTTLPATSISTTTITTVIPTSSTSGIKALLHQHQQQQQVHASNTNTTVASGFLTPSPTQSLPELYHDFFDPIRARTGGGFEQRYDDSDQSISDTEMEMEMDLDMMEDAPSIRARLAEMRRALETVVCRAPLIADIPHNLEKTIDTINLMNHQPNGSAIANGAGQQNMHTLPHHQQQQQQQHQSQQHLHQGHDSKHHTHPNGNGHASDNNNNNNNNLNNTNGNSYSNNNNNNSNNNNNTTSNGNGNNNTNNNNRSDDQGAGSPPDQQSAPQRRKKASRACFHCQKAHLTCDDSRPCQRCVKRDLASTCADGVRKKAKYLQDAYDSQQVAAEQAAQGGNMNAMGIDQKALLSDQDQQRQGPGGMEESPLTDANALFNFPMNSDYGFGSEAVNLEYSIISTMLSSPTAELNSMSDLSMVENWQRQGSLEAMTNLANSNQLQKALAAQGAAAAAAAASIGPGPGSAASGSNAGLPNAGATNHANGTSTNNNSHNNINNSANNTANNTSSSTANNATMGLLGPGVPAANNATAPTGFHPPGVARVSKRKFPSNTPENVYANTKQPFNYTDGFHYLLRYVRERMDKEEMMRICRAMAMFRPSFIALIMNLTPEDLIFMEKCFQRTILEFEKLISFSGTPTVVWRRTGEIALVGKEFSLLTQWGRDQLVGKKTYIYELMDNQSAVEYWEKFSTHAFENTEQTVMTTCILLSPTNRVVPCTFCFTIKRDIFDIPLAIVGNFLPILS